MKLFAYLIVGWVSLSACCIYYTKALQLGLWVWKTCPEQKNEQEKGFRSRETFFEVGCTIQMICTYMDNYCDDKESTSFNVYHRTSTLIIHEVNRTKCSLVFEIRNLTLNDQGYVVCNDTISGHFRLRNFRVGYPPVPPENLTIVFEPMRSVALMLDRVKTGKDLNDNSTQWNVIYTWRDSVHCSKEGQQIDTEDGRFIACYVDLQDKYEGDGQYKGLGNMSNPITFTITVVNIFGVTPALSRTFYPKDYVKPHTSCDIKVKTQVESRISLQVICPSDIVKHMCHQPLVHNNTGAFRTEYTVTNISEEEQHRRSSSNNFYELYGLYRNLENDVAALNVTDTFSTSRPFMRGENVWPDCRNKQDIIISGLPLPNTYYKISVRAGGHYWGPWADVLNKTAETVPREGPRFDNSFYMCLPPENECVTCLVYFKEIPRPLRGGDVLQYTLIGERSFGSTKGNNCSNASNFRVMTGGKTNTIVVENLALQAVYNLSLQAKVAKGFSPSSTATLNTSLTSDTVSSSLPVVIERHGGVSLSIAHINETDNITYFVHRCYGTTLQTRENSGREYLNCKTNLVKEQVNSFTKIKPMSLTSRTGSHREDLIAGIYVSMRTPVGAYSPLIKPDFVENVVKEFISVQEESQWLIITLPSVAAVTAVAVFLTYYCRRAKKKIQKFQEIKRKVPNRQPEYSESTRPPLPPSFVRGVPTMEGKRESVALNMDCGDSGVIVNMAPSDKSAPVTCNGTVSELDPSLEQRNRQSARIDNRSSVESESDAVSQYLLSSFRQKGVTVTGFRSRYEICNAGPHVLSQQQCFVDDDDDDDDEEYEEEEEKDEEEYDEEEEEDDDEGPPHFARYAIWKTF